MASTPGAWQEIFGALERFHGKWPATDWSYDHRLRCVTSVIESAQAAGARTALTDLLPMEFNAATIGSAADGVRAVATNSGGLRGGQLLLWSGAPGASGPFGLWWPWGDGSSVSLRVGLHDIDLPKERYPRLREIFGIVPASVV